MEISRVLFSEAITDWKKFEKFVAGLYWEGDVKIEHNVFLIDVNGNKRQVDVLLTAGTGPLTIKIVIECKYWKKPVEREDIDKLGMTIRKTDATKGVIFTTTGFRESVVKSARDEGIDLFCVSDPEPGEWWPSQSHEAQIQLCTYALREGLHLEKSAHEDGTFFIREDGVDITYAQSDGDKDMHVRFGRRRTENVVLGRKDGATLEHIVEQTALDNLLGLVRAVGPLGDSLDCVGYFSVNIGVTGRPPLVVAVAEEPPQLLRICRGTTVMVVRIEQRRFHWSAPEELALAAMVRNVVTGDVFQVGLRDGAESATWLSMNLLPAATQIQHDHRLVVISDEGFNAHIFDTPWGTFDRIELVDLNDVPESRTIRRVMRELGKPGI